MSNFHQGKWGSYHNTSQYGVIAMPTEEVSNEITTHSHWKCKESLSKRRIWGSLILMPGNLECFDPRELQTIPLEEFWWKMKSQRTLDNLQHSSGHLRCHRSAQMQTYFKYSERDYS